MMRTDYSAQVAAVAAALELDSENNVTWCGRPVNSVRPVDAELTADALTSYLSRLLYQGFYVFGEPLTDLGKIDQPSPRSRAARFVERLVAANAGRGHWQLTSAIETSQEGLDVVCFAGVRFVVPDGTAGPALEDGRVTLDMPGVLTMNSPGHVLFFGDCGPLRPNAERTLRFYWNVTAERAPALVEAVTEALNAESIPFQLKVRHTDQPWTQRADPAVLYLDHSDVDLAWPLLRRIQQRLKPLLRSHAPALTRRLGLGLAVADDPKGKTSFGLHRCRLMADGLVKAHLRGQSDLAERVAAVAETFADAGLSLDAPYLNPGSPDLDLAPATQWESGPVAAPVESTADWVGLASRIGDLIARQALWHDGRCTWLERTLDTSGPPTWQPVGAEVYGGLAGLGLLFAQLWTKTGQPEHRRHAYGAARHALVRSSELGELGLYAGATGAGLGIALTGEALQDAELFSAGTQVTIRAARRFLDDGAPATFDLLYGTAGAIVALIGIHRLGDPSALEIATALGKELVGAAITASRGAYWKAASDSAAPGAVGMAHGASGSVWALAELASATGDAHFRDLAELGCEYERGWFDPELANWPDLRDVPAEDTRAGARWDRFHWCYGAPGIALARIRLTQAGGGPAAADEAITALAATRHAVASFPKYGHDVSLCHGAAGLAEVMSLAPPNLANADDAHAARQLLATALAAYRSEGPWLSGCGLMTGAGGVAYSALRAAHPELVSPLLLIPVTPSSPRR